MKAITALFLFAASIASAAFEFRPGDRVVFVGNTFAERMVEHGYFEGLVATRLPEHRLSFRNLGWSGDTVIGALTDKLPEANLRPLNFGSQTQHLSEQKPDVIIACYGMAESFAGKEGLAEFEKALAQWLDQQLAANYAGKGAPRVLLVSPIAHETQVAHRLPKADDPTPHNEQLAAYTEAMKKAAEARATKGVGFIDLYAPTTKWMAAPNAPKLTFNGIHLTSTGYRVVADMMASALNLPASAKLTMEWQKPAAFPPLSAEQTGELLALIEDKNQWFFWKYHAVNGEYIYGRRKEPFGVVNFPGEMKQLEDIAAEGDRRIWELTQSFDLKTPKP
jgi:lysophospholipase L1-like esterase